MGKVIVKQEVSRTTRTMRSGGSGGSITVNVPSHTRTIHGKTITVAGYSYTRAR